LRRRASQVAVISHLSSESGRRLSALEKTHYVVDKAIELANQEEEEDNKLGLGADDDKEEEVPKDKNWKFLPYEPVQGDPVDELLAEQLNIFEIDVDIRPLKLKNKKKKKGRKEKEVKEYFIVFKGRKRDFVAFMVYYCFEKVESGLNLFLILEVGRITSNGSGSIH